jgi:type I restriction enzyme S subunit
MSPTSKTSAAEEEAKPVVVPKLRFPEFRGEESWENKHIGPYLEDCSGRVPPDTELPVYSSTREGLKRQDAYFDGRVLQNKNDYGVVPPGCLVYRHMSDDGLFKFNINETGGEIAVSKEYPVFSTKGLNSVFLLAKLNDGLDFKHFALSQKAGGTRTRLYFSRLCEWRTLLPYPAEQQKIAECLSSVDELLAAQALKVDALKTHKKGLMHQLFPREGETEPRLRFPEFHNAGEWDEKKLGTICDIQRGKFSHRPRNDPKFFGGQYPFIQTGDVVKSEGGAVIASQSLNEEGLAVSKLFKPTVVLITIAANIGDTGLLLTEGCFTDSVVGLIPQKGTIPVFLELIMRGQKDNLNKVATTGAQKNINNEILREVSVLLPSVPEQQRIASCLSSLDALITAETQKHEALKTHKKGLMQQLFPSLDEVDP